MKRFVVARIIGSGTEADAFRPAFHGLVTDYSVVVGASGDLVKGAKMWCLALVAVPDQAALDSLDQAAGVITTNLGPEHLDNAWSSLPSTVRRTASQRIEQLTGYVVNRNDTRAIRAVLRDVGRSLDAGYLEAYLDCNDPYAATG